MGSLGALAWALAGGTEFVSVHQVDHLGVRLKVHPRKALIV